MGMSFILDQPSLFSFFWEKAMQQAKVKGHKFESDLMNERPFGLLPKT